MRGMSRPSKFTPELAAEICDRIAEGESLRAICREDGMPDRRTVLRWLDKDSAFAARCAKARELQADALEEGMAEVETLTLAGELDPKAANVVLSSRRWRAEKLAPKRYGVRNAMELTGANGGPVQLSDADRAARLAGLLALAQQRRDHDASDLV